MSGISKCLQNVFALQIGIINEQFLNAVSGTNLTDNHADGYPHAANARFSTHEGCVLSDAIKRVMAILLNISSTRGHDPSFFLELPLVNIASAVFGELR